MTINEILKAEKEDGRIEGACDAMKAIGLSNSEIIQKLGELYQLTAAEAEAFLEP